MKLLRAWERVCDALCMDYEASTDAVVARISDLTDDVDSLTSSLRRTTKRKEELLITIRDMTKDLPTNIDEMNEELSQAKRHNAILIAEVGTLRNRLRGNE